MIWWTEEHGWHFAGVDADGERTNLRIYFGGEPLPEPGEIAAQIHHIVTGGHAELREAARVGPLKYRWHAGREGAIDEGFEGELAAYHPVATGPVIVVDHDGQHSVQPDWSSTAGFPSPSPGASA